MDCFLLVKVRDLYKWLMAFVGVQFVFWSIKGTYMVFFDIDYIHGGSMLKSHQTTLQC